MAKGFSIDVASPVAWKDGLIKERYFITPLALGSTLKRSTLPFDNPERLTKRQKKEERERKGKEKGKGKKGKDNKRQREGMGAYSTPDGKKICFGFNNKNEGCTRPKRSLLHVCGKCYKDHPTWQCTA